MDPTDSNRRRATRFAVVCKISIEVEGRTLIGRSRDISEGGVFVRMPSGLSTNMDVELTVETEAGAEPIHLRGRVVHAVPGLGSGIAFEASTPEAAAQVAALIRRVKDGSDPDGR
jgi:hypothetical protein